MNETFLLNCSTVIVNEQDSIAIDRAVNVLKRDISKVCLDETDSQNCIILSKTPELETEQYKILCVSDELMQIVASDDLGFIYGLLKISSEFLGIKPFWFWMDQEIERMKSVRIPINWKFSSVKPAMKFRGWFINDEVLIDHITKKHEHNEMWRMAYEALLRCGGNMIIPGTDRNSHLNRQEASDYGLWITHHHAEPLGATMFSRAYPELEASYLRYPELFVELWEKSISEQKNQKTIFNLGFRGQGDCPFWANDPSYDTPEKRGALISEIIEFQYQLVHKQVSNPICCINLYGEVMELYNEGFIHFRQDIIKIWADNGYGKMVSRRHNNENPRVPALPKVKDQSAHGMYYHVSFYDLQAANHMTMLPIPVKEVSDEIHHAMELGVNDYIVVNCSNIRPHVYMLDLLRKVWEGRQVNDQGHSKEFVKEYLMTERLSLYECEDVCIAYEKAIDKVADCYVKYAESAVAYGIHSDERAGDQFYNYSVRVLGSQWIRDRKKGAKEFLWACNSDILDEQISYLKTTCLDGVARFTTLQKACSTLALSLSENAKVVFSSTLLLQVELHLLCLKGVMAFCEGYELFGKQSYFDAFYAIGQASDYFAEANGKMRDAEYGSWIDFYENDCLTDIKFTAYHLRKVMSFIREIGEGSGFYQWERLLRYSEEDRRIVLLTNIENHMTDEAMYSMMKQITHKNR